MIRYRKPLPSADSIRPGPQRADELEHEVAALDALEAVAQELRVEADLERFAGERHRQRSRCASPTSGVCAETVSSPSLKRSRSGAFFCAMRLIAAHDLGQLADAIVSSCS